MYLENNATISGGTLIDSGGGLIETAPGNIVSLPVFVPGAYLYLGDAHAAMGHGELSASGLEMPSHTIITVNLAKGKKIAGSSPGGSATLLANQALKQIGLEPGKDVSVLQMSGNAASRYAVLESGIVDASLLSVPENIIAQEKGYHELLFLGDVVEFPQNGFGTSEKRIRENPDEVYRMVRATLRGLQFVWEKNNQEAVTNILMKQWKVNDRKMAAEMARQVNRVLTKDAYVKPESVQVLIDLARDSAKVTKPVSVADVVDYTFLDKARKELGFTK